MLLYYFSPTAVTSADRLSDAWSAVAKVGYFAAMGGTVSVAVFVSGNQRAAILGVVAVTMVGAFLARENLGGDS